MTADDPSRIRVHSVGVASRETSAQVIPPVPMTSRVPSPTGIGGAGAGLPVGLVDEVDELDEVPVDVPVDVLVEVSDEPGPLEGLPLVAPVVAVGGVTVAEAPLVALVVLPPLVVLATGDGVGTARAAPPEAPERAPARSTPASSTTRARRRRSTTQGYGWGRCARDSDTG